MSLHLQSQPGQSSKPGYSGQTRRVVVTGLGAVTPLGLNVAETWSAVLAGRSGISPITLFDPKDCPVTFAGQVKDYDSARALGPFLPNPKDPASQITQAANPKEARRMGRFTQLALSAGLEAYADSGLDSVRSQIAPDRMGVNIGVGMGGLPEIEAVHEEFLQKGYRRITPFFVPQSITNMASGQLSILLHLQGPNLCNVTACTSSAHALGESKRIIERGDADIMLAGGSEAVVCKLGIGGFAAMKALSTRNDAPQAASRPFDLDRDGFVMGEGGVVLVLEEFEHARKRGAKIYAELLGYGLSGDAYHMTSPSPEGEGAERSMKMALSEAARSSSHFSLDRVGYVNAHATSTPAGDIEEARAIARVFAATTRKPNVSSTKSMTGHLLGAAGAIEGLFSILAIRDGVIPPTINLERLDPVCAETGLDFTAGSAQERKVQFALSNSFGFGGTNGTLLFGAI